MLDIDTMSVMSGRAVREDGSLVNIAELIQDMAGGAGVVKPQNYLYVAKSGDDTAGDGSANSPYLTISKAILIGATGTTVFIFPGTYTEDLTLKSGVNLTAPSKYSVYVVGTVTFNVTGTVYAEKIIFKTSGAGNTLNFAGTGVQNLQTLMCNFEHTTGNGHCIYWTNTNASSRFLPTDGNITQVVSSGGGTAFTSTATAAGSIILGMVTVQLSDSLNNICIYLGGAVSWNQTQDQIIGQVVTANTARYSAQLLAITTGNVPVLVHNSSNATPSISSSVVVTTTASPTMTGVGAFLYFAIGYGGTGVGGASTLNGGLGPIPLSMATYKLRDTPLYPAGALAAGVLNGMFEFDGTHLYFDIGTTRTQLI